MTDPNISRRNALKAALWAAPVIAVAVAAPAAAASGLSRIRFTNVTATEGKQANIAYVNTKVQVIDGPSPVTNLVLVTKITGGAVSQTFTNTWSSINGWGNTEQVRHELGGLPKGPIIVTFVASADGVQSISDAVSFQAPSWWS